MLIVFLIVFFILNCLLSKLVLFKIKRIKIECNTNGNHNTHIVFLKSLVIFFWAILTISFVATIGIYKTISNAQNKIENEIFIYENDNQNIIEEIQETKLILYESDQDSAKVKQFANNKSIIIDKKKQLKVLVDMKYKLFFKH